MFFRHFERLSSFLVATSASLFILLFATVPATLAQAQPKPDAVTNTQPAKPKVGGVDKRTFEAASIGNTTTSTTNQKQFAFEVIAIHPMKPGFSPYDQAPAPVGNMAPSPSGFSSTMVPGMMVQLAYGAGLNAPIDNMPDWFTTWYFINARVADKDAAAWQKQSGKHELLRPAMQAMLRDRFKLAIHQEPLKIQTYALVVGRKGVRFKPSMPGAVLPQGLQLPSGGVRTLDLSGRQILKVHFYGATMADLADLLRGSSRGLPVEDATELTGYYDFTLELDPQPESPVLQYPVEPLGLTLKSVMTPSYKLVIDHVEPPSAN